MLIKNASVFTHGSSFEEKDIEIEGSTIKSLNGRDQGSSCAADEVYDASGCTVIPGLVDLHFHGCVGSDISDHDAEGIRKMAAYELKSGITAICPATMTLGEDTLSSALTVADAHQKNTAKDDLSGAMLVGINLEGPFVSPKKKGAQNEAYIKNPDIDMFHRLMQISPSLPKLITLAPELPGAMDFIKEASKEIVISLGHSTADYETAMQAFEAGASHVTHLFNAMPPFAHRDTGIVGAAFDTPNAKAEMICDGIHVSDSMIRAAFRLFTDERIILISDSMRACGMPDGSYTLGGQDVTVKGRLATLADGTIAGSVTNLMDCMRHVVQEAGIPLASAVKAATFNPAKELGIEKVHGQITEGALSNLLILDSELQIKDIVFQGKLL